MLSIPSLEELLEILFVSEEFPVELSEGIVGDEGSEEFVGWFSEVRFKSYKFLSVLIFEVSFKEVVI